MGSGGIRRSGISAPGPSSDGWITKHRQLNPGVYEIGASPLVAAQEKRASEAQRITFSEYADEYLTWCTSTSSRGATASLTSSSAGRSGAPKTHSVRQTGMRKRRGWRACPGMG